MGCWGSELFIFLHLGFSKKIRISWPYCALPDGVIKSAQTRCTVTDWISQVIRKQDARDILSQTTLLQFLLTNRFVYAPILYQTWKRAGREVVDHTNFGTYNWLSPLLHIVAVVFVWLFLNRAGYPWVEFGKLMLKQKITSVTLHFGLTRLSFTVLKSSFECDYFISRRCSCVLLSGLLEEVT